MASLNQFDAGRNVALDRQHRVSRLLQAQKITYLNLIVYATIMVAELVIGYTANISVLVADGLNNLTGVFGAAILIIGLHLSIKPPDKSHLLGHWQFENIASFISASIMFAVSIQILISGFDAFKRYLNGQFVTPNTWSLGISLLSGILIFGLANINSVHGTKLNNQALITSGKDLLSDSFTSFGTFLSIAGAYLGIHWLDAAATTVVGFLILSASISIFKTTTMRLTEGFDPKTIDQYRKTAAAVADVIEVQSIEPRYLGDQIVVQVGIYLADNTKLSTSYVIGENVEKALMQKYDILDADVKAYPISLKRKSDVAE
ncbi:cation diffusion facilitator family transporter [Lentilactobacillus sp. Marseille-Q4993]|uniref:cation diffusion facilitator family transporter n=1 Tax=Lentilactobacillus sp. Marseille-Q4993 TaxID=3039492 RepID=UPI0024BCA40A|nr:cation diffusion facilitator family transporter [Lentilactobacillus sp. Marseille-Q4993]